MSIRYRCEVATIYEVCLVEAGCSALQVVYHTIIISCRLAGCGSEAEVHYNASCFIMITICDHRHGDCITQQQRCFLAGPNGQQAALFRRF
eukprot:scaffold96780_cov16-Prasinocladus_malaysianus.AAC.1